MKLRKFFKPWVLVAAAVAIAGGILIYRTNRPVPPAYVAVERGAVEQVVSVTGQVKPAEEVDLAFEKGGRIARVYKQAGDQAAAGEIIASLASGDFAAQLAAARADADAAAAKLDDLKNGARPEEVAVKQTALDQAKLALQNNYRSVFNTLDGAYVSADDAVRKQLDPFFTNDEEPNPALTFQTFDFQAAIDAQNGRAAATVILVGWRRALDTLGPASTPDELDKATAEAENDLVGVQNFLKRAGDALIKQSGLSATVFTSYQTALTAARTGVSAALASVTNAGDNVAAAKLAVAKAENDLNLTKAGSTPETIRAQEAALESARAKVQDAETELAKTTLRAPFAGTVTREDAKAGEIAAPQAVLVKMMSNARFQIQSQVPETDIGRIAAGKAVRITFDALQGETFSGKVIAIDPAETVIEGVATYKTTVELDSQDPRIKSGMTADMEILVDRHENALLLPQRAVSSRNGKKYATLVLPDGKNEEREILTGLRGQEGEIEVLSGLAEGDKVLRSGE